MLSVPRINHPDAVQRAGNKVYQLRLAATIGFLIPETLVTNNPESAKNFMEEFGGDVIVKPFTPPEIFRDDHYLFIYTTELRGKELGDISDIALAPCIFQERIEKK
jgi:hypothetical protein